MIIISNDCSCYPFYNDLSITYNHPFISNILYTNTFIYIATNLKTIPYIQYSCHPGTEYACSQHKPYLVINVNNLFNIHYIHFNYHEQDNDERYERRYKRLLEAIKTDNNIIFICNENKVCNNCYNILVDICNHNNYKLIYCQSKNIPHIEEIFTEEILNNNILKIPYSFRPRDMHGYILQNDKYKKWLLGN